MFAGKMLIFEMAVLAGSEKKPKGFSRAAVQVEAGGLRKRFRVAARFSQLCFLGREAGLGAFKENVRGRRMFHRRNATEERVWASFRVLNRDDKFLASLPHSQWKR